MTDKELQHYFWKILDGREVTREQQFTMFQVRDFWHNFKIEFMKNTEKD